MQSNTGSEEHLETPILQYAGGVIAAKLDRTEKELVHGVSFHISRGESLTLIGETGSGKTLIAQSVMGVLPGNVRLVSGEVLFCGKALPKGKKLRSMLGREIVYIPVTNFLTRPEASAARCLTALQSWALRHL